jgi:hypothetical protein
VDNNYLDLSMSQSGFIHTLPSGRLTTLDVLPEIVGTDRLDGGRAQTA